MNAKNINAAERLAIKIAKSQKAANANRDKDILSYYTGKPPKAPEPPKRHSTDITRYYE